MANHQMLQVADRPSWPFETHGDDNWLGGTSSPVG
jgi:hypothetical protein